MFKHILLPLDLGHESEAERLFSDAADLAQSTGAKLHVMTVVPDFGMPMVGSFFPANFEKEAMERGRQELSGFTARQAADALVAQHIVGHGSIYKEIVKAAAEVDADLIVMGVGRSDEGDYLLGHNASRVMRHAKCSVMVMR